jgi:hypothetical protein
MILRLLAWASLAATILFAILGMTVVFARDALGETGPALFWYGALPLLGTAIVLALTTLIAAAFQANGE